MSLPPHRTSWKSVRTEILGAPGEAEIPPSPEAILDSLPWGELAKPLEKTSHALGRLDGIAQTIQPCISRLMGVREAAASSRIEGIHCTPSDLAKWEAGAAAQIESKSSGAAAGACIDALREMQEAAPDRSLISLMRFHQTLMKGDSHPDTPAHAGRFRTIQNWIGGRNSRTIRYVPPPPSQVESLMDELEAFLSRPDADSPVLLAIAHLAFQSIHPFVDGNGRTGRAMAEATLRAAQHPGAASLALSAAIEADRPQYYRTLNEARIPGKEAAFVAFFLKALQTAAESSARILQEAEAMFRRNELLSPMNLPRRTLRKASLHLHLMERGVATSETATEHLRTDLGKPVARRSVKRSLDDLASLERMSQRKPLLRTSKAPSKERRKARVDLYVHHELMHLVSSRPPGNAPLPPAAFASAIAMIEEKEWLRSEGP